jgi:hypothetical protein
MDPASKRSPQYNAQPHLLPARAFEKEHYILIPNHTYRIHKVQVDLLLLFPQDIRWKYDR